MLVRKKVLIPAVSLSGDSRGCMLELMIETAELSMDSTPQFSYLKEQGLEIAAEAAKNALAVAGLPTPPSTIQRVINRSSAMGPPALYLANPRPNVSNSSSAALGVVLGLLMYDGRCPGEWLIATGRLDSTASVFGLISIKPDALVSEKLALALSLGQQSQTLPFLVPAKTIDGEATAMRYITLIRELMERNIHVIPVATLEMAVANCWRLDKEGAVNIGPESEISRYQ
ncbi:MAG: hypothetical protein GY807_01890 [Gammaproteobacteria bacterium]|nr:hypothetical protein [Gammaproteobacteria bacterium]